MVSYYIVVTFMNEITMKVIQFYENTILSFFLGKSDTTIVACN